MTPHRVTAVRTFTRSDLVVLGGAAIASAGAGAAHYLGAGAVLAFVCSAVAVALLASLVLDGESNWIGGAALIAVDAIIAAAFWWG